VSEHESLRDQLDDVKERLHELADELCGPLEDATIEELIYKIRDGIRLLRFSEEARRYEMEIAMRLADSWQAKYEAVR
jgi:aryl carrier-like protein